MVLQEISFRLQHDSPYNNFSRKYPEVPMSVWCNHDKDILEVRCEDRAVFQKCREDIINLCIVIGTPVIRYALESESTFVLVKHCSCYYQGSILQALSDHNLLYVPPVSHREGWEHYRIIGFGAKDSQRFFRGLKSKAVTEILSKRVATQASITDYSAVSLGSFLADLTKKQIQAFLMALELGYYELPKRTTLDQIANVNRIPRSTFESHVRKAESKIMQALGPYVKMGYS